MATDDPPYYGAFTPSPIVREILETELPQVNPGMQWNAIVDFWHDPCEAPLWFYIQLAIPLLGAAFLILITPSPEEIVENYIEPDKYAGCWRGRKEKRSKKDKTRKAWDPPNKRRGLPDIDSLIAGLLLGRGFFAGRRIGPEEGFLWFLYNRVELVSFAIMLVDLLGNAFYAWHSALLESEYCQATAKQMARCGPTEWAFGTASHWQVVVQNGTKESRNGGDAGIQGITITRRLWRLLSAATVRNYGPHPATYEFRMVVLHGTDSIVIRDGGGTLAPGEHHDYFRRANFTRPGQVIHEIRVTAGVVWVEESLIWGEQTGGGN